MKKKRIGIVIAALALVAAIGIGATLAYFTDSDSANNTITFGHVDIDLDEPQFEENTEDNTIEDVTPGQEIVKDPTITAKANSAAMYIRAKIEYVGLTDEQAAELEALITFANGWVKGTDGYYYYQSEISSSTQDQEITFFTKVTIPTSWGNELADASIQINVTAEAIQADNFTPTTDSEGTIVGWKTTAGADVTAETYAETTGEN